jgi:hypothetical protein
MPVKAVPGPPNGREQASSDDIGRWMDLRDQLIAEMQPGAMQPGCISLLEEVATALRMAAKLREAAEEELFVKSERSGRSYAHPGIGLADIEVRRAALLLQRVDAMAKSRPAGEGEPEGEPDDPLDHLDSETRFDADPVADARIHFERRENQRRALKGKK